RRRAPGSATGYQLLLEPEGPELLRRIEGGVALQICYTSTSLQDERHVELIRIVAALLAGHGDPDDPRLRVVERPGRGQQLLPRRGDLKAGLAKHVRAVEDGPLIELPRDPEVMPVVLPFLVCPGDHVLERAVALPLLIQVVDGERLGLRIHGERDAGVTTADVRRRASLDRGEQLLRVVAPAQLLVFDVGA